MTCLTNFLGNAICKISFLLGFMVVVLGASSGTSACKIEGLVFVFVFLFWIGGWGLRVRLDKVLFVSTHLIKTYLCELAYY